MFCELSRQLGSDDYAFAARTVIERLQQRSVPVQSGVEWNDYTDVIRGTAGIGLALLHADDVLGTSEALKLAEFAGARLIQQGQRVPGGTRWEMTPGFRVYMPNFSHGTAGVAYFLARLYENSSDGSTLQAALRGANHLKAIANLDNEGCIVMHNDADKDDLYYLGWCHGPVGTSRLFHQLARVTEDPSWHEWVIRGSRSILDSGIPEKLTPGFWNNVGSCCGSASVLQFFIDLHNVYGNEEYLTFATRMADDILSRGEQKGPALRWLLAENRTQPDVLIANTGLMQGAAGVGLSLLALDSAMRNEQAGLNYADSPFGT